MVSPPKVPSDDLLRQIWIPTRCSPSPPVPALLELGAVSPKRRPPKRGRRFAGRFWKDSRGQDRATHQGTIAGPFWDNLNPPPFQRSPIPNGGLIAQFVVCPAFLVIPRKMLRRAVASIQTTGRLVQLRSFRPCPILPGAVNDSLVRNVVT